jgi:hypothetical protein
MTSVCSRGRRGQKHYTVFIAKVTEAVHNSYAPVLNAEHTEWRWVPLRNTGSPPLGAPQLPLHPVMQLLLSPMHAVQLHDALS